MNPERWAYWERQIRRERAAADRWLAEHEDLLGPEEPKLGLTVPASGAAQTFVTARKTRRLAMVWDESLQRCYERQVITWVIPHGKLKAAQLRHNFRDRKPVSWQPEPEPETAKTISNPSIENIPPDSTAEAEHLRAARLRRVGKFGMNVYIWNRWTLQRQAKWQERAATDDNPTKPAFKHLGLGGMTWLDIRWVTTWLKHHSEWSKLPDPVWDHEAVTKRWKAAVKAGKETQQQREGQKRHSGAQNSSPKAVLRLKPARVPVGADWHDIEIKHRCIEIERLTGRPCECREDADQFRHRRPWQNPPEEMIREWIRRFGNQPVVVGLALKRLLWVHRSVAPSLSANPYNEKPLHFQRRVDAEQRRFQLRSWINGVEQPPKYAKAYECWDFKAKRRGKKDTKWKVNLDYTIVTREKPREKKEPGYKKHDSWREIMAYLGCSRRTAFRKIKEGFCIPEKAKAAVV